MFGIDDIRIYNNRRIIEMLPICQLRDAALYYAHTACVAVCVSHVCIASHRTATQGIYHWPVGRIIITHECENRRGNIQ